MNTVEDNRKNRIYEILTKRCDEFANGKFLLASLTLSKILQCITGSNELNDFVIDVIKNIDIKYEFNKACKNDEFIMPKSNRINIALVTFLLREFDSGNISLVDFVIKYFDKDINIGFDKMCNQVLDPYKESFKILFLDEIEEEEKNEFVEAKDVHTEVHDQAMVIIQDIITQIQGSNKIKEEQRLEMFEITEGLIIALSMQDSKLIKAIWVGIKYTFIKQKKILKSLLPLEKLFNKYGIL